MKLLKILGLLILAVLPYNIIAQAPTITSVLSSTGNGIYKVGDVITIDVIFSEDVDIDVSGGIPTLQLETGNPDTDVSYSDGSTNGTDTIYFYYTVQDGDVSAHLDYTGTTSLALNGCTILASDDATAADLTLATPGNAGSLSANQTIAIDGIVPFVSSILYDTPASSPTNSGTLVYQVTFSESVTGVTTDDFTLTTFGASGTISGVSANSGTVIDVTVNTVTGDGTIRLDLNISGTGITDDAGNAISGGYTSGDEYTIDNTAPSVSSILYDTPASSPTTAGTLVYQITFSESVTGVSTDDFTLTASGASGTISGVSANSGTVIDVTVNTVTGDGTIRLDLNSSGTGITDNIGNAISGGYTSGDVYTIDNTAPSVSSILYDTPASSPANAGTLVYQVTFSESVTGVTTDDFTLTTSGASGTISGVSANSGTVIDVTVNSVTGDGTIRLDLNNSGTGITDDAGNPISGGYTSGDVYTIDNTAPSVSSILYDTPASSPTNAGTLVYQVTFSESVTGVTTDDFTLTTSGASGTISGVSTNSGTVIDVTVNSVTGDGTIRLDLNNSATVITDDAGNPISGGFTTGDVYEVDRIAPTITLSSPMDPTNTSPVEFTVQFSEDVTGFEEADLTVTKTDTEGAGDITVTNFDATNAPIYTFDVEVTHKVALIIVNISADVCVDAVNNGNEAATELIVLFDKEQPVPTISTTESSPTNSASIPFEVNFSKNVNNFIGSDIVVGRGSVSNFVELSDKKYTFDIIPASEGIVTVDVPAAVCVDGPGNENVAALQYAITYDITNPEVNAATIESDNINDSYVGIGGVVTLTITGSENIIIGAGDVTIAGQNASISGSGKNWTASYTMTSSETEGNIDFTINCQDLAGNTGSAVSPTTDGSAVTFDKTIPTLKTDSPAIHIESNNATNTSFAKAGDEVSITFESDEKIVSVEVKVEGKNAVVSATDSLSFSAIYTLPSSYTLPVGIDEKILEFSIDFKDLSGNSGGQVTSTTDGSSVTIDPIPPDAPGNLDLLDDGGRLNNDNITGITNPEFFGLAEAFSEVSLYSNIDGLLGTVSATDTATFFITVSLSEGDHSITATATDGSGNVSPISLSFSVKIDATEPGKPGTPDMDGASDSGTSSTDNLTNDDTPTIAGSTEANARVIVYDGIDSLDYKDADIFGVWSLTLPSLSNGDHSITVSATDLAGNTGSLLSDPLVISIDRTIPLTPAAPQLDIGSDTGTPGDNVTSDATPVITGSTEEDATIALYSNVDGQIGTATANASGDWSITASSLSVGSQEIYYTATDLAGNQSANSGTLIIAIDKTVPGYANVSIYSNNLNPEYAVPGDEVYIDFETTEAVVTPQVEINGINATSITGGPNDWLASRALSAGETEGAIPFSINIEDPAGNKPAEWSVSTDNSSVTYDDSNPLISSISVNNGVYKVGDIITVLIQSDDIKYTGTTVEVNGKAQTLVNNLNNNYTIEYQVEEGDAEISSSASLPVNIVLKDPAGLTTSVASASVNGGTITIDAITPIINLISSNAEADENAIIGDEIVFTVKPVVQETGLIIQPATYNGKPLNWTTADGSAYTGIYTVVEGDPEQEAPLQLGQVALSDVAGNVDTDTYNLVGNKIFTAYPSVAITGTTTKCDYGQTVPITFSFTGRKPFELIYSDGTNAQGPVSINSSNYIINVENGTYSVISLTDSTGNYVSSATNGNATITVVDLPQISTSYTNSPYSIQSPRDELSQYVLQSDKRTGVFSGEAVGYAQGAYYFYPNNMPAALLDKDVEIIYTYTDPLTSCFNTDTNTVFVSSTPVSIIGLQDTYCEYDDAVTIKGNLPPQHTGQYQVFDAGSSLYTSGWQQTDSLTLIITPKLFEPGTYTLVYTAYKYPGLEVTNLKSTKEFEIEALPENILITNLFEEYCFDDNSSDIQINVNFDPPIGSIGNFIPDNGSIDVFKVEPGEHEAFFKLSVAEVNKPYKIGYIYESDNGCIADTIFQDVIVNPLPELSFDLNNNYNYDVQNVPLQGIPKDQDYSFSGEGVSRDTLFTAAARLNVPIIVSFSGSDQNGCYKEVLDTTIIYRATETIQGINETGIYCYQDTAINISCTPSNPGATGGTFRSLQNAAVNTGLNAGIYYLDSIGSGTDTLYFDYYIDGTGYTISKAVFVDSIGKISISSPTSVFEFCNSIQSVRINGNKQYTDGGSDYFKFIGSSGEPVDNFDNSIIIEPIDQEPGTYELYYLFTSNRGCASDTTQLITVLPEPVVDFYQPVSCPVINQPVEFINQTTFSGNEQDIAWEWNFEGQSISEKDPVYSFNSNGTKEVVLTATVQGCIASESKSYTIGNTAIADFTWDNECATGEAVNLINKSSGGVVEQGTHVWKINGEALATTLNASFQPDQVGEYLIELDFTSNENCHSEISKELVIQPYIRINDDYTDATYVQDFESDQEYYNWYSTGLADDDISRWKLGIPSGDVIDVAASGTNAWYTSLNSKVDVENSQIVSPCFDLRGLEKPMIKMNIWSSSEFKRDGAVLQYSIDIGKTWQNLGETGEGINWFNSENIQSQPGGDAQFIGWNEIKMTNWKTARHNLDSLYGEPNVRFRVAYASDGSTVDDVDGFAFDDVWIGNRQQHVLAEYFTNTGLSIENKNIDQYMVDFEINDSIDVISLHYHTGTPEGDKLFELYPSGPLTRVYYYGVSTLPLAISNGTDKFDLLNTESRSMFETSIDTISLKDPEISIAVNTSRSSIEIVLTALADLVNEDLVVYAAIVMDSISNEGETYYNILQKFLPDPSGVALETSGFAQGETISETINFGDVNFSELEASKVVVFAQNTKNNQILQVVDQDLDHLTAVQDDFVSPGIIIYPNPVESELFVQCDDVIEEVRIIDITGRVLTIVQPDQKHLSIPFDSYRNGIYFINGRTSSGEFMKKIIKN